LSRLQASGSHLPQEILIAKCGEENVERSLQLVIKVESCSLDVQKFVLEFVNLCLRYVIVVLDFLVAQSPMLGIIAGVLIFASLTFSAHLGNARQLLESGNLLTQRALSLDYYFLDLEVIDPETA